MILPVYNGEMHIVAAVDSILQQTFADFELLVVDDGSTDGTPDILRKYSDPRLRIIRLPRNAGHAVALNSGIQHSDSEFIARMDADDISLPYRLERQVAFLRLHTDVSICGTWFRIFGIHEQTVKTPVHDEEVRARLFFRYAVAHPTAMMRRSFLLLHQLAYDQSFAPAEDYDLFSKAAELTKIANIPEVLLLYREHALKLGRTASAEQAENTNRVQLRQLRQLLPHPTDMDCRFHLALLNGLAGPDFSRAERWLTCLEEANRSSNRYVASCFRRELEYVWYELHRQHAGKGVLASYWHGRFASLLNIHLHHHIALGAECLARTKRLVAGEP